MDFSGIALSTVGPAIAKRARWSWLGYGVAAYVALRVARRYGWFGEYPDRILSKIDTGVNSVIGRKEISAPAAAQI